MANTVTQRTLYGAANSKNVVRLITIVSDGTEESDLVIYDNSALVNNVAKGRLIRIIASGSSCQCQLKWDQSTDSPAFIFDPANSIDFCFKHFGGISNPNATGATGDLLLTTTNLDSGDVVSIIIEVEQN